MVIPVGIVGTRHGVDDEKVFAMIDAFIAALPPDPGPLEIVSGGGSGVDDAAERYAALRGFLFIGFRPDRETGTFGQRCFKRNKKIADRVLYLLALPCEHSKGSYITARLFNERELPERCTPVVIPCSLKQVFPRKDR